MQSYYASTSVLKTLYIPDDCGVVIGVDAISVGSKKTLTEYTDDIINNKRKE